jgi:regulator of chromosome condensation
LINIQQGNDGVIGFSKDAVAKKQKFQTRPTLIPELKNIKTLAAGGNHIQALDSKGNVFAWGSGQQNQLGRRIIERTRTNGLVPSQFGLPKGKITYVACGSFNSFAIDKDGKVYSWGLNNYGQTGVASGAGESDAFIDNPTIVKSLSAHDIREIKGGNHHSVACTKDGKLLVWGRCDDAQAGIPIKDLPKEDLVFDERNKPRILKNPTQIPGN